MLAEPLELTATTSISDAVWYDFVETYHGSFLQTTAWGEIKGKWGWRMRRVGVESNGALVAGVQVLFRTLPLGRSIAYIPRGPVLINDNPRILRDLFAAVHHLCRQQGALLLTVEPDWPIASINTEHLLVLGFRGSIATVQPSATIMLDLTQSEDDLLAQMHQKWRYNIRLAGRKDIKVRIGTAQDLDIFHTLTQTTGQRDDFAVRPAAYYTDVFRAFGPLGRLWVAEYDGKPLAAIMVVTVGRTATYLYGASSNEERQRMPNHAIQWAAIQEAKADGCLWYDFWGIPPEVPDEGEPETLGEGGLWGVYRFKQGFGGKVVKYPGALDYVYNRPGYWLYNYVRGRRAEAH